MSGLDAVVIGAGANGLVAANILADHGWDVLVLEGADSPGAVRTDDLTLSGFRHDTFSSFYPFAAASPTPTSRDSLAEVRPPVRLKRVVRFRRRNLSISNRESHKRNCHQVQV